MGNFKLFQKWDQEANLLLDYLIEYIGKISAFGIATFLRDWR
jgi:hypothetical protein